MSHEAVQWAMDKAPMLLTDKGKPDTTARHVLAALAEHARPDGTESRPSVLRLQFKTGLERRTIQRALRRLEDGKLIERDGTVNGCQRWKLAMSAERPASDWTDLQRDLEAEQRAAANRQASSRARRAAQRVTDSDDVTVTDAECVTTPSVTHADDVTHAFSVRDVTHSESGRHALNAARTFLEPSVEPEEEPMAGGRRPTTGSWGEPPSGSAATDEDDDAKFTATAADKARVFAGLPGELRRSLDRISRFTPLTVAQAISEELGRGLTVERLVERAQYRWQERYEHLHRQDRISRPIGVAVALFRNDCTSDACDDGIDLWTTKPCPICADRRAERTTLKAMES